MHGSSDTYILVVVFFNFEEVCYLLRQKTMTKINNLFVAFLFERTIDVEGTNIQHYEHLYFSKSLLTLTLLLPILTFDTYSSTICSFSWNSKFVMVWLELRINMTSTGGRRAGSHTRSSWAAEDGALVAAGVVGVVDTATDVPDVVSQCVPVTPTGHAQIGLPTTTTHFPLFLQK